MTEDSHANQHSKIAAFQWMRGTYWHRPSTEPALRFARTMGIVGLSPCPEMQEDEGESLLDSIRRSSGLEDSFELIIEPEPNENKHHEPAEYFDELFDNIISHYTNSSQASKFNEVLHRCFPQRSHVSENMIDDLQVRCNRRVLEPDASFESFSRNLSAISIEKIVCTPKRKQTERTAEMSSAESVECSPLYSTTKAQIECPPTNLKRKLLLESDERPTKIGRHDNPIDPVVQINSDQNTGHRVSNNGDKTFQDRAVQTTLSIPIKKKKTIDWNKFFDGQPIVYDISRNSC